MPLVHLARHGSHGEVGRILSGRSDIALSDRGNAEATWLAARLATAPITAIYSSPRRRAVQTAEAVARMRGLDVRVEDALDEIDFGAWTGLSFDTLDRDPRWHAWNAARGSGAAPGGETMLAAVTRARRFIEGLTEAEILCVSHCDIIRGVVASYLGLGLDRLLAFDCDPASLTTLQTWPGGGKVVTLNERPPHAA